MATIISVPLAQQLQVPFIGMRSIYEARERPSRTYSWTALVTSQIIAEVPWNMLGSSIFFLCWYFTVGFSTEATRAGYIYLALGVIFPWYYTTVGQAIAAMSPNAEIAALLFSFLFSFVLVLCVHSLITICVFLLTIRQQRRLAALPRARMVEVDVPPVALLLPDRRSAWIWYVSTGLLSISSSLLLVPSHRPPGDQLCRDRVRAAAPAIRLQLHGVPAALHQRRGRVPR